MISFKANFYLKNHIVNTILVFSTSKENAREKILSMIHNKELHTLNYDRWEFV